MIMNGVLMASSLLVVSFSLVLVDRCDSATKKVSAVRRRISGDFLKYYEPDYWTHVCSSHSTYLVLEDQCINNSKLFNECSFAITPKGQPQNLSIILGIGINGTSTALTATRDRIANAAVTFKDTGQPVNSSTCQISSLEVYRGREQAIEISHQGFSLSDDCSIEVHQDQLAYNFTEYLGELYCMNLSCSENFSGLMPCLFFKAAGKTNLTDAKFNCTVPGTLMSKCSTYILLIDITSNALTAATISGPKTYIVTVKETITTTEVSQCQQFAPENPLFYGVAIASSIIVCICGIINIVFCVISLCLWHKRKCSRNANTTLQVNPAYGKFHSVSQDHGVTNRQREEETKTEVVIHPCNRGEGVSDLVCETNLAYIYNIQQRQETHSGPTIPVYHEIEDIL